jgi:antirestriction protein ArdC
MNETNQTSEKKDVYTIVTDQVITQLEKGIIPWRRPWSDGGIPQNLLTKRSYRGINLWLLAMLGYGQNYFLTYKQVQELGGKIKKDETGHVVIYWKYDNKQTEDVSDEEQATKRAILRYYLVFNISQCEGIPDDKLPPVDGPQFEPLLECENIIRTMHNPPDIQFKENEAYYHPGKDYINMPKRKLFKTQEEYYAVLFHELIHSTGHPSRVGREGVQLMTPFGSTSYSKEELIAEMGSCYLTHFTGIAPKPLINSVAYIQGWLDHLQNNKKMLIFAASQAQKAVDYILVEPKEAVTTEEEISEALVSE